jgi:hypothetical protein
MAKIKLQLHRSWAHLLTMNHARDEPIHEHPDLMRPNE